MNEMFKQQTEMNEIFKQWAEWDRIEGICVFYTYVLKHNCKINSFEEAGNNRYVVELTSEKTIKFSSPIAHHAITKERPTRIVLMPKDEK